jgi:acetyltransferase-like isoleucine patch superfamily enzyme
MLRFPFQKPMTSYRMNVTGKFAKLLLPRLPSKLDLGKNSYANDALDIHCFRKPHTVVTGKYCSLGACTFMVDGDHNPAFASTFPFAEFGLCPQAPANAMRKSAPSIGHDCWICDHAVVYGNLHIGDGAIVAGNAVVTKSVPAYAVVAGNPARVVKYRFDADTIARFVAVRWWDLPDEAIHTELAPLLNNVPAFLDAAERLRRGTPAPTGKRDETSTGKRDETSTGRQTDRVELRTTGHTQPTAAPGLTSPPGRT